ncbi:MAG: urease accessory protein UreE [Neomegalonema sp.]|nr:urease accessory protein UreE [Neomegalonema sp.]
MIRAQHHLPAGSLPASASGTITLDYDARFRRRIALTSDQGLAFLLDLPEARELREGDALQLEDGRLIEIRAAAEPVADLRCTDPLHLVRVAWHLGNRHLPTQIFADRLRIRQDAVIEAMAQGLGAEVLRLDAPFNPEGGAYGAGRTHSHSHSHSSAEADHRQGHAHAHAHTHTHTHSHHHHGHERPGHEHSGGPDHEGGHSHD